MIALKMNYMKFTTIWQKTHELGANMTGMNMSKNWQRFFEFRKTTKISKHNKELAVDDKETTEQKHILEHIR